MNLGTAFAFVETLIAVELQVPPDVVSATGAGIQGIPAFAGALIQVFAPSAYVATSLVLALDDVASHDVGFACHSKTPVLHVSTLPSPTLIGILLQVRYKQGINNAKNSARRVKREKGENTHSSRVHTNQTYRSVTSSAVRT